MEYGRALSQISAIHQHLARTEVYRGYRPVPVALSGLVGLLAAALQTPRLAATDPLGFVIFWTAIAAVAALAGSSEIAFTYLFRQQASERRRTRLVIGQFLPSLVAGGVITLALVTLSLALVPLLPGLWALMFGVAVCGARPYLPRATGWVALFYLAVGAWLLWNAGAGAPSPWEVGGTFGAGQLLASGVLYWNLERHEPGLA
jgi:hypothetical protein